jgi:hypothetical protein
MHIIDLMSSFLLCHPATSSVIHKFILKPIFPWMNLVYFLKLSTIHFNVYHSYNFFNDFVNMYAEMTVYLYM